MKYVPKCWNKGIPRTEKEKENIRNGISKEARKRASERMKTLWKAGNYDSMFGDTNPACRAEVKEKIGIANSKREVSEITKQKIRNSRLGKPGIVVSEKRKKEYSIRMKMDNPMFRKEVLENHPVLKSGPNFLSIGENKLIQLFTELGFKFQHQKQIAHENRYYTVDFYFPLQNKIIEFDGHSSHILFPEKDIIRDAYILKKYGYKTLRLLPPDLNLRNRKELIEKLYTFLDYEIDTDKNIKQKAFTRGTHRGVRFNRTR